MSLSAPAIQWFWWHQYAAAPGPFNSWWTPNTTRTTGFPQSLHFNFVWAQGRQETPCLLLRVFNWDWETTGTGFFFFSCADTRHPWNAPAWYLLKHCPAASTPSTTFVLSKGTCHSLLSLVCTSQRQQFQYFLCMFCIYFVYILCIFLTLEFFFSL